MDVFKAIQTRRSIRQYQDKPVESEKLQRVLDAGRLSPSARNLQDWQFVVVQDKQTLKQLVDACNGQSFVGQAPAFIAACATKTGSVMSCGQPKSTVDLSIAMAYMILEAWEEGLGTCWLGSFKADEVRKILGIPETVEVVAVTPLGYPAAKPKPTSRKSMDDVVSFERYRP